MDMPATCDHCGQKRDLKTHLLPWTTRRADRQGFPISTRGLLSGAICLMLCDPCGRQREEDLRRYFRGGQATKLVALEPEPRPSDGPSSGV